MLAGAKQDDNYVVYLNRKFDFELSSVVATRVAYHSGVHINWAGQQSARGWRGVKGKLRNVAANLFV